MTSMWAALGAEALGLFVVTGGLTAMVRNKLRKTTAVAEAK